MRPASECEAGSPAAQSGAPEMRTQRFHNRLLTREEMAIPPCLGARRNCRQRSSLPDKECSQAKDRGQSKAAAGSDCLWFCLQSGEVQIDGMRLFWVSVVLL